MQGYMSKISGPLLDRIDLYIEVQPVPFEKLSEERRGETCKIIRERVTKAREIQTKRFSESKKYIIMPRCMLNKFESIVN